MYYRTLSSPHLPPLIILHGLWGASENWLPVGKLLAPHFYVILPDIRNHGQSHHDIRHDYNALAQDMVEFIRGLKLPAKPFIAGHSMGGKILMALLSQHSELVNKAAVIDIAPKSYSEQNEDHLQLLRFILSSPLSSYKSHTEITALIHKNFREESIRQLLLKNVRRTAAGYQWKINAEAIQKNIGALMDWTIPAPIYHSEILFIKGQYSPYITKADLPAIKRFFPAAILTSIPDSTHAIHVAQPNLLAAVLSAFFLDGTIPTPLIS